MQDLSFPCDLVIFDCDGVLIDSEVLVCRVGAEVFTAHGFPITAEEIARRFIGRSAAHMFGEIEKDTGRVLPETLRDDLKARVNAALAGEVAAMPGLVPLLDRLEVPACVASSSDPERLRAALGAAGLYDRFHPHVYSAVQVPRGKPAPDLFLHAAARLGVDPGACLVIEDSLAGVAAALAAGMAVIGFTGGGHCGPGHDEVLLEAGAGRVVPSMTDLQRLLCP
ncbi:MAG: HAD-IA family hydrolase [Kiloniellales bacterium]|nr:HAD-IA family hydrolase [Kiloniellales bacterium]MDJ0969912.1 HAD-IA family hydrolase [Kiloniellales bacterium]